MKNELVNDELKLEPETAGLAADPCARIVGRYCPYDWTKQTGRGDAPYVSTILYIREGQKGHKENAAG